MRARVLAVLLGLFLTPATSATAENLLMGIALQCESEPGKILELVQEKYGETPLAVGQGVLQNITGKWQGAEVLMTVNPESKSYSIIIRDPVSGVECILLAGNNFKPAYAEGTPL